MAASRSEALGAAGLVVGGGAGAGDAAGWALIADLARALSAPLGATRPAVDEGWAPSDMMIGQSGQRISPQVYLTVGVSGDLQHLVGVAEETTIIAINADGAAPIFGRSEFGVVGDFRVIVAALLRHLRSTAG